MEIRCRRSWRILDFFWREGEGGGGGRGGWEAIYEVYWGFYGIDGGGCGLVNYESFDDNFLRSSAR